MPPPDDERFRVQPGKPRSRGDAASQRFVAQVLRAAQKGAGGAGKPLNRSGRSRGAEKGRGHVVAKLLGGRVGPRDRRVIVKARLVVLTRAAPGSTGAHLRYIRRDGVTREGAPGEAYGPTADRADVDAFEARGEGDRHQFRFIVSPEDAAEIDDLQSFTRDLMRRVEADLGTKLDWVAVDHWDTDNPHTHLVLRGTDGQGRDLIIGRDYIAHGLRMRASALATEWLGPQTELELRERLVREAGAQRWTGMDRKLAELARAGVIDLAHRPAAGLDGNGGAPRRDRLQTLERLGLAQRLEGERWSVASNAEATLRAMGERGDIVRSMQRALGAEARPLVIAPPEKGAPSIVGRIAGKGLVDELQDQGYLVVDSTDGRAHYVRLPDRAELKDYPLGGIVEARAVAGEPRSADRAVAALASGGVYRAEVHLAEAQRAARPGDDPRAFVDAHVRRLEALRRAGTGVERLTEGVWRIPPDFLARASAFEAEQTGGVRVELRSHLPIAAQARAVGATWLDRTLVDGAGAMAATGFGAAARKALEERAAHLVDEGLATRRNGRIVLARDLLATLQAREVAGVGRQLAVETGLEHRPVEDGDPVRGVYRRSLQLVSGRFAMLDDGVGFSLVPWKPVIEQRLGQTVAGVVRGGSVSWDLSRQRGIGV